LKDNKKKYQIIHVQLEYHSFLPLFLGIICGYKIRIAHSHNTIVNKKIPLNIKIARYFTKKLSNYHFGCSKLACDFLFGTNCKDSYVIYNFINYDLYKFNEDKRIKYRNELGIGNYEKAIVFIGRLEKQKNHQFLFNLMEKEKFDNIKFFLLGEGIEIDNIRKSIELLNLEEKVILLGTRGDVNELLNAFDLLILPSLHEGFPIVLVEAQVNGLKCLISDAVTKESDISGNCLYIPLDEKIWIEEIKNNANSSYDRNIQLDNKYDSKNMCKVLMGKYEEIVE
jgi:glycosyltransferase involved in cell wall biosynthesis